ncbi:lysophospholipid acyltransferase family protein [Malonomonas rubra]|uniref:lysophospholipid acyltransferase family protein n=1 Tax=Malonomonas rubra TaxID=57040 RepID=UPI0026EF829D|nr:lysophospholipid acyltransferase family protein [Malonomonas rubra]
MRLGDRLLVTIGPFLASIIIRLLYRLNRIDFIGEQHPKAIWQRGEHLILAFWHDQLLLMVKGYRGPGSKILISASKDGELIARVMQYFGQQAVRGSSSRGGRAAFKEMVALANEEVDLVITPDGPKGPRHELKDGVVQLARMGNRPVVPMAFACSKGHRFASWDKFLLPYPFGRGVFSFGVPVCFNKDEGVELFREKLIAAIAENQQQALAHLEGYGVSAV